MLLLRTLPVTLYNTVRKRIWPVSRPGHSSPELKEIEDHITQAPSDISDHLPTIFSEAVAVQPRLIVELGVRGGESRFALERAARLTGSHLVSVDLEDCSAVCTQYPRWHFVKSDDIEFARIFNDWCADREIEPRIDVLFIDTSHVLEHTLQEIRAWFPYLTPGGKVIFHDTNTKRFYRRSDGTIGEGLDCKRGVIRAIEEYLDTRFNERMDFVTTIRGWLIRHWAHCNGLMTMERTRWLQEDAEGPASDESGTMTTSVTVP